MVRIEREDLVEFWPLVAHWVEPALRDPSRCGLEDLEHDLVEGQAELWVVLQGFVMRAAVVTRLVEYPRSSSLLIQLCGGEGMPEWVHLIERIEEYARARGCVHVEIQGRRGWERVLDGYKVLRTVLAKEL